MKYIKIPDTDIQYSVESGDVHLGYIWKVYTGRSSYGWIAYEPAEERKGMCVIFNTRKEAAAALQGRRAGLKYSNPIN